jgi:hypothetical protein
LENTDPDSHRAKERVAQEEKIFYDGRPEQPSHDGPTAMSATSYPGQEWHPYGYEEGLD